MSLKLENLEKKGKKNSNVAESAEEDFDHACCAYNDDNTLHYDGPLYYVKKLFNKIRNKF